MFDATQYSQISDRITGKLAEIPKHQESVQAEVLRLANEWYIPSWLAESIVYLGEKLWELANWAINLLNEVIEGLGAPVMFWETAYKWESARGIFTGVAAELNPASLGSTGDWKGAAATAYTTAITPQSAAAARLGASSDKVSGALQACAVSGLAFYAGVLLLVAQFVMSQIAAAAATATGVAAPVGLLASLSSGAFTLGAIVALVGTLSALLGVQASQLSTIHGEAEDGTAFPGGHWPVVAGA